MYIFIPFLPVRPQIVSKIVSCTRVPSMGANLSQNLLLIRLIIGLPRHPDSRCVLSPESDSSQLIDYHYYSRGKSQFSVSRSAVAAHPFEFIFQVLQAETRINRFTISDSSAFIVFVRAYACGNEVNAKIFAAYSYLFALQQYFLILTSVLNGSIKDLPYGVCTRQTFSFHPSKREFHFSNRTKSN